MADAATGPEEISKDGIPPKPVLTPKPQAPISAEESEARIIEETVIPAKQKPVAPPTQPVPAKPLSVEISPQILEPQAPEVKPAPEINIAPAQTIPPVPTAIVVPQAPAPTSAPVPILEHHPESAARENLPEKNVAPPRSGILGDDIANILKGVKLPERRDAILETEHHAQKKELKTFDTGLGAPLQTQDAAQPAGEVPAVVTPQSAEKNAQSITAVHTLKDDLQGVVREQRTSLVSAVSLEEDRRARRKEEQEEVPAKTQRSKRTFAVIFSVLLLCVLGGGALFGVYTIMQQHAAPAPALASSSILFAEQSFILPLGGQSPNILKQALVSARNSSSGTLGSITRIVPVVTATSSDGTAQTRSATFGEFMAAIGAHPPDDLIRALGSDFFFGMHTVDKNAPLFVIPVVSYDHAFADMLAWEPTMNADLAPIFTAVPNLTTDANGLPVERTFQDLVMRNYDVRALEDNAGTVELYYSFPTQNILIIAESPYSFPEILSRLQASREL